MDEPRPLRVLDDPPLDGPTNMARDEALMTLVGTDDYLNSWEWSGDLERPGPAEEVLAAVLSELETDWEARRKQE